MMSLRTRFFLISWPIVVAAVLAVALGVERWVTLEFVRLDRAAAVEPEAATADSMALLVEEVARQWETLSSDSGGAALSALAASASPARHLVLLDAGGRVVGMTDPTLTVASLEGGSGGSVRIDQVAPTPSGAVGVRRIELSGWPVRTGDSIRGYLYEIPAVDLDTDDALASLRLGLRRTLWSTVLAASVAAAAASLLLAGPLVRQISELGSAAAALRAGVLSTRTSETGVDEIGRLGQSFNAMAASLEQADRHKRNLVSDVAHELRTPLTNILGSIEAMQDGLRDVDDRGLASLRDEATLLAALVDELQELSLAESGQLTFDFERVDAVTAAAAAVDAARDAADGVVVVGPADDRAPAWIRADPRRLAQVLRNLLRNALAHTPSGGTVRVDVEEGPDTVEIRVSDTGCGIPAAHLPLIWERFHRVEASRDRSSGGMGLGLALVRHLVEHQGGVVDAESTVGRGSIFRVRFPTA